MAVLHAQKEGFDDLKIRMPPGRIWASPDKPAGYLRNSVLTVLAKKIGDQDLPEELIDAGTFDDTEPATGSPVRDEVAAIKVQMAFRDHQARKEGYGDDEEEEEEEEDDDGDDNDDDDDKGEGDD